MLPILLKPCPCDSQTAYHQCCEPLHTHLAHAETALALMRSRYSAYVLGLAEYIYETWHPDTQPSQLNELIDPATHWLGLRVDAHQVLDPHTAKVRFSAEFKAGTYHQQLNEESLFYRLGERWFYHSGEVKLVDLNPLARVKKLKATKQKTKLSRNQACFCGSGKKYKHCCGR